MPDADLPSEYEKLRRKIGQQNFTGEDPYIARNWSKTKIVTSSETSRINLTPQNLCLSNLNDLCCDRYLVSYLSPEDLVNFPEHTLGGAFFQYMNDGKFYEFDKNPLNPDSDLKWLIRLLRQTHDFYHLASEVYHYGWKGGYLVYNDPRRYEDDLLVMCEEICIYAFMMGQIRLKEVIPIVVDWANNGYLHCETWLKVAYPIWRDTEDHNKLKDFEFFRFIGDCEKFAYASMKLGQLDTDVCVDEYMEEFYRALQPLPSNARLEEHDFRNMILESFERGLRSKPLICFQWNRYLANDLKEVRDFLNIPRRKLFKTGSHFLKADLLSESEAILA